VHTDGEHIVINIVDGLQKAKNIARDRTPERDRPRRPGALPTPSGASRQRHCRGRQGASTRSPKYLGIPYPNFGVPETRLVVTIEADAITPPLR
jgi:hypothetical protein